MKKIYLHIGTEKTGTTTIQQYCKENRASFLESGVVYPKTLSCGNMPGHFVLAATLLKLVDQSVYVDFVPDETYIFDEEWAYIKDQIVDSGAERVLLSCEHFSSRFDDRHVGLLRTKLMEYFPEFNVEVLVSLRRQDALFESAFSTSVKSGSKRKLSDFFEEAIGGSSYFDYFALLNRWERHFGCENLIVTTFDELMASEGLLKSFFEQVGINVVDENFGRRANRSLSPITSLCGRLVNEWFDRAVAQEILSKVDAVVSGDKWRILTQRESAVLVQRYAAGNKEVAKKFCGRANLFDEDDYVWVADYKYLSENEAKNILLKKLIGNFLG